ncbi:hypothetical protein M2372_000082 [Chryseobacterium sp. BIGb0232]|nr:hypothetical protein [Chryseobacterium sp. BIGb0232]
MPYERIRAAACEQTCLYFIIATKGFTAFRNWRKLACYFWGTSFSILLGFKYKERTKVNHLADKK